MIDILLVNPKEEGAFFEKMPPLGLAYIAAVLEKQDYSVRIVDFEVEDGTIQDWLDEYQPKYLGISGTSHTRFESFRLAKEAKLYSPDIVTIYGGVHATFTGLSTLQYIKEIDYVVCGEGENTIIKLLGQLAIEKEPKEVRGICFRKSGDILETVAADRVQPLDSLPRPAYHRLNMERYSLDMEFLGKKGISLLTSRGCYANCTFCSASKMFGHQVTTHSASRMLDEIEFLFNTYGYQGVKLFDSTFTMKRDHVYEFCDEIQRRKIDFPWECEIRVGTVDRDMLEKMRHAGCYYVNFGVESASQRVLNLMRKGITVEQAEDVLHLCKDAGVRTKVFFSFGHIGETMDDVDKTFRFIDKHEKEITTLASGAGVRIYPGTYLETYAREKELLAREFDWSLPYDDDRLERILQTRSIPVLAQPQMGFDDLERVAVQIYRRKFKGWQGFKKGITKVTDPEKLRKLKHLAKIRLKNIFKGTG
jgi:anaerobic magnesium-protoporphyrin IX monomethyl ester cyclase